MVQLWFAFNSVYLNYQKQLGNIIGNKNLSCDLLSIQYIWTTRNNIGGCQSLSYRVVICFQFSIFELPETTEVANFAAAVSLWFAFNSVYLNYQKQWLNSSYGDAPCCDLLSIQYIWTTRNNCPAHLPVTFLVVICFQFSIFELPETTRSAYKLSPGLLWFAFNSVYLNYQKQQSSVLALRLPRCDLLSIQYIWTTRNNRRNSKYESIWVVICFQFSIFELPETTVFCKHCKNTVLWFAFNSVYLNYQKQLNFVYVMFTERCDLLSIQYIWTTRNNQNSISICLCTVVICFQFSIFELPETTNRIDVKRQGALWFAFNSVYLNYQKQRSRVHFGQDERCDLLSIQYIWTTRNNTQRWRNI